MIETDPLLGRFTDQHFMLSAADPQQDAPIGLSRWRTRFPTITDWTLGNGGLAAFQCADV